MLLAQALRAVRLLRRPMTSVQLGDALGVPERTARRVLGALELALPEVGQRLAVEVRVRVDAPAPPARPKDVAGGRYDIAHGCSGREPHR